MSNCMSRSIETCLTLLQDQNSSLFSMSAHKMRHQGMHKILTLRQGQSLCSSRLMTLGRANKRGWESFIIWVMMLYCYHERDIDHTIAIMICWRERSRFHNNLAMCVMIGDSNRPRDWEKRDRKERRETDRLTAKRERESELQSSLYAPLSHSMPAFVVLLK